ncbi:hypothetical protein PGN35_010460 [Nodosilinea sp. PGN35]|uniref:hypothetical protein n=1 Tax=Nodosilinea sp. PGN35 TaxID=3020489 RepID=UPI0023B21106|nr:hypothetical protein [Nodosilinea sp. TSF1-S3]MDF0366549.1 hypothetical protein [Nodosilinea sp. TSF1-S3]
MHRGARQIIAQAVEAELQHCLVEYRDRRDEQGRQTVARNGYLGLADVIEGVPDSAISPFSIYSPPQPFYSSI